MRGIFRSVIDFLASDDWLHFVRVVVGAGIQVRQVVREVAAGDFNADLVTRKEDIAGRTPEIDGVFVHFFGFYRAELLRIKRTVLRGVTVAGSHDTVTQQSGIAIRIYIDQPDHPVRVAR